MNEILRNYAENLRRQQTARSTALFMQERGNPDEVANALRLGGELQVPPAAVLAQPERFQMEAEARRTSEIFDRSPRLREWIENDPINGQLAGDDLASLAEWEAMLGNNGSGIGNAVRRGTLQVRAGANVAGAMFAGSDAAQAGQSYEQILSQLADAYGGMEMFGQLPTSIQARLQESAQIRFDMLSSMTEDDALARLETAAEGYAAASDLFTRAQALPVSDRAATFRDGTLANAENTFSGTLGAFFRDPVNGAIFLAETAAETLPVLAGATAATAVARNPAAGAMVMTGGSFLREQSSEAMAFLQERGVDISTPEAALAALSDPALLDEAAGRGLTRGIIIGVLDGLSGGIAGQTLMDNPAGDMVAQALAQGLLAGTGEAGAQLATDGEISPQDVVIEALAELVTLPIEVAGVGGRIGIPSLRRTPEATDLDRAEAAGTTAATLQQIDQMAAQTQTRTRSPDRFAQYLERVGAAEQSVYVPAADFREYAQSQNLNDEEIAALGIDAQEMSDMEQSGGYVAVPLNEYAARIAGTPAAEWFQQNGVLDPATEMSLAMAQREGQSLMDEAMEQARQMRESERELQQTERRVYDEVREQLRQAGRTPDVADSEATFFTAFFNTMAARYGADPFELYERFGLLIQDGAVLQVDTAESVTANLADTQTLEQAAAAVQRTPEFEAWFGDSAVRDANGAPLVVYHGTAENIQAFQDFTGGEDGFYFSSSPDVASGYAAMRGDMVDNADYPDAPGANVIPAYLSLQNPLIVDMGGSAFSADGVQDAVDRAREAGNDGVVFRNMVDPADGQPSASADTIIAFDPSQIKSIFNERPTSNPRILYQGEGEDGPRANIQIPAAGVERGTTVINLFEGRDLSSVIHEGGHYFYEVFATLASDANAPNQMKADLATLQSWMGIQPGQALTTEAHEKMARGMERYVMEGKAPSLELATVFGRFKAWLTNVYRTVRRLNVSLTPEVREVFDRMLATDEAIAQAQADMGGRPMFAEAPANMEQGTWETYQRLERQRTDQANQKMLDKAMDDVRRRREQKWKDERAALVEREMDNLAREPVYRLFEALANQKWIGNEEAELPPRINRDTLEAMGVDLNTISRNVLGGGRAIYTTQADEAGMHPREAAEFFGFPNVGRMIEQLQDSGKRAQRAEERADAVMAQMYPDLLDDASMQAEALEAVHSSRQAEMVALELRHIARQRGQDQRRIAARFFQQRARAMIGQMEVRQAVNPNRFLTAERQAARKAEQAFATVARGGRTSAQALAEAQQAKEQQLLNHYLYLEARDLERTVKRKREEMRSYDRQQVRERVGSPHIEQIDAILSAYEFRQRSQRQIDKSMSLARYVELMDKGGVVRLPSGEEVEFTGGRLDELAIDPRVMEDAQRTHYTRLTVDELRGVFDTVDNIAHVGRRTREVVTARGKRLLGESAMRVANQIRDNQRLRRSPEGAGAAWQKFVNGLSRVDTIAVRMDGGEEFGTFHSEIKKEIDIAQGEEQARSVEMMERVQEIFSQHYTTKELRDIKTERIIPGAGTWTKEQLLVLALNTGTESNFQRIMDPRVDESVRMTGDRLDRVLGTLDERDWRFAQDVLDLIDSYYPELAAVNRRMTGVDPKKVEARPMWPGAPAFFRGGYYRLFYDADLGGGAENVEVQNLMTEGMSTGFGASAQVGNGMTKQRLQTAGGKAVRLEFTGITQQLRKTVRFITLAETVNGTARILNHPEVKAAFRDTGNQRVKRTLDLWLKDIASGPIFNSDEYNSAARFAKNNFTLSRLALNWKTVLLQVTGLTQSAVTIGPANMARGIVRYGRNLTTIHREIIDKSPFMRERMTTFQKDIMDFRNEMRMANPVAGRYTNFMDIAAKVGFEPMIRTQFHAVDVPTWLGAYEGALAEGQTEQEAVYRADRMVARAQDSALQADRSAVERGTFSETTRQSDVIRLFTTLGGYMIAKMNRANVQILKREMQIKAADTPALRAAIALRLAGDLMVLYAGEAVVMGLLYELMDDDDDYGDLAKFIAAETGSTVIGGIPVVRDVAGAFRGFEGGVYGSVTAAPARFAGQVVQGDLDDSAVRAALDLVGTGTGLPSTATYRIVEQFLGEDEGSLGEAVFGSNPLNR
jgi:hypothetical protein